MAEEKKTRRKKSPRRDLTDKICAKATAEGLPQFDHYDAMVSGLCLRVTTAGKKFWDLTFKNPVDGKRARMNFGTYPATPLTDARDHARAARRKIEGGKDPRAIEPVEPVAVVMTVADVIDDHISRHLRHSADQYLRTCLEIESIYDRVVIPIVGDVPIADFRKSHLNMILDPIIDRGSQSQAANVFRLVNALVNWAVGRDFVEFNRLAKAKSPKKGAERTRYLTTDEIVTFWHGSPQAMPGAANVATILRLELALGQRVGEISGMRVSELNLKANRPYWTIPLIRVKNKKGDHVVPLNAVALDILRPLIQAAEAAGRDLLFPNLHGEQLDHHVIIRALSRALKADERLPLGRLGVAHFTSHDLRRTVSTHPSRARNNLLIADKYMDYVLNHTSATKGTVRKRHYDPYEYFDEKADALDEWGAFLARLIADDAIVPLKVAA